MSKKPPPKPVARLRKGKIYLPRGQKKTIEAVSEEKGSGQKAYGKKFRGKIVGRGVFTGRSDVDKASNEVLKGLRANKHRVRFPDGSIDDPEEE